MWEIDENNYTKSDRGMFVSPVKFNLWEIRREKGGKVPNKLHGTFDSENEAKKALFVYMTEKYFIESK